MVVSSVILKGENRFKKIMKGNFKNQMRCPVCNNLANNFFIPIFLNQLTKGLYNWYQTYKCSCAYCGQRWYMGIFFIDEPTNSKLKIDTAMVEDGKMLQKLKKYV